MQLGSPYLTVRCLLMSLSYNYYTKKGEHCQALGDPSETLASTAFARRCVEGLGVVWGRVQLDSRVNIVFRPPNKRSDTDFIAFLSD